MTDADEGELRLLARLHYGLAVLTALFPLVTLPVFYTGIELLTPPDTRSQALGLATTSSRDAEAEVWRNVLGKLAVGGVAAVTAVCLVHGGVLWYVSRQIAVRRRWWLVMIFSALHLVNVPLGTALSIFAFVVLARSSVTQAFGQVADVA